MPQNTHFRGEVNSLYLAHLLAIGQQKKKAPPMMKVVIFIQYAISVSTVTRKQTVRKIRVAAVFRG